MISSIADPRTNESVRVETLLKRIEKILHPGESLYSLYQGIDGAEAIAGTVYDDGVSESKHIASLILSLLPLSRSMRADALEMSEALQLSMGFLQELKKQNEQELKS